MTTIDKLAYNLLIGFMLTMGICPSDSEVLAPAEAFEIHDYGPHRVYTYTIRTLPVMNPFILFSYLEDYVNGYNSYSGGIKFHPYHIDGGLGVYRVSIYHDADL